MLGHEWIAHACILIRACRAASGPGVSRRFGSGRVGADGAQLPRGRPVGEVGVQTLQGRAVGRPVR